MTLVVSAISFGFGVSMLIFGMDWWMGVGTILLAFPLLGMAAKQARNRLLLYDNGMVILSSGVTVLWTDVAGIEKHLQTVNGIPAGEYLILNRYDGTQAMVTSEWKDSKAVIERIVEMIEGVR